MATFTEGRPLGHTVLDRCHFQEADGAAVSDTNCSPSIPGSVTGIRAFAWNCEGTWNSEVLEKVVVLQFK